MSEIDDSDAVTGKAVGGKARAAKLSAERKAEIARKGALARWGKSKPIGEKMSNNNQIATVLMPKPIDPKQRLLDLQIQKQIEIDGVGMGVLTDGTPFLTGRGLARLCGVNNARIVEISADWSKSPPPPAIAKIKEILEGRDISVAQPHVAIRQRSGDFYAYPDVVCLAVLEFYAFDASRTREQAKKNFRLLAGKALREFIYTQVGYDPRDLVPDVWRQFHDRVSLTYNSIPAGYFGIFKEMSDMIVTLGQAGAHIDEKFVPDISVGQHWGKHWSANCLDQKYGSRIKYEHNYPDYFPQAESNPQEPWCYPDDALAEFRRWIREDYIGKGKFAKYLDTKVKQAALPASFAQLAIASYSGDEA
jgi:hypothetical protein